MRPVGGAGRLSGERLNLRLALPAVVVGLSVLLSIPMFLNLGGSGAALEPSRYAESRGDGVNLPIGFLVLLLISPMVLISLVRTPRPLGLFRNYILVMGSALVAVAALNYVFFNPIPLVVIYHAVLYAFLPAVTLLGVWLARGDAELAERAIRSATVVILSLAVFLLFLAVPFLLRITIHPKFFDYFGFQIYNFIDYWPLAVFLAAIVNVFWYVTATGWRRYLNLLLVGALGFYFVALGERMNIVGMYVLSVVWLAWAYRSRRTWLELATVGAFAAVALVSFGGGGVEKASGFFLDPSAAIFQHRERSEELATLWNDYLPYSIPGFLLLGKTGVLTDLPGRIGASQNLYAATVFKLGLFLSVLYFAFIGYIVLILARLHKAYTATRARSLAVPISLGLMLVVLVNNNFQHATANVYTGSLFFFLLGMTLVIAKIDGPHLRWRTA